MLIRIDIRVLAILLLQSVLPGGRLYSSRSIAICGGGWLGSVSVDVVVIVIRDRGEGVGAFVGRDVELLIVISVITVSVDEIGLLLILDNGRRVDEAFLSQNFFQFLVASGRLATRQFTFCASHDAGPNAKRLSLCPTFAGLKYDELAHEPIIGIHIRKFEEWAQLSPECNWRLVENATTASVTTMMRKRRQRRGKPRRARVKMYDSAREENEQEEEKEEDGLRI